MGFPHPPIHAKLARREGERNMAAPPGYYRGTYGDYLPYHYDGDERCFLCGEWIDSAYASNEDNGLDICMPCLNPISNPEE